jgi:hypothetical protein
MKRIAALGAAAAVIFTLTAITQATAQSWGCATWEKQQKAEICFRNCTSRWPTKTKAARDMRRACQDACIAACRII